LIELRKVGSSIRNSDSVSLEPLIELRKVGSSIRNSDSVTLEPFLKCYVSDSIYIGKNI